MRHLRAIHEDKEESAEKDRVAKVHARVAEALAQVKKWMKEPKEDSARVKRLRGR